MTRHIPVQIITHGDVTGQRIVLELAQHGPAEHVGQEHVERDGARLILFGELQRLRAAGGDQHLESLVAREIDQHARVMRVVLDDHQDAVAGLEVEPVVGKLLDDARLLVGRGRL